MHFFCVDEQRLKIKGNYRNSMSTFSFLYWLSSFLIQYNNKNTNIKNILLACTTTVFLFPNILIYWCLLNIVRLISQPIVIQINTMYYNSPAGAWYLLPRSVCRCCHSNRTADRTHTSWSSPPSTAARAGTSDSSLRKSNKRRVCKEGLYNVLLTANLLLDSCFGRLCVGLPSIAGIRPEHAALGFLHVFRHELPHGS